MLKSSFYRNNQFLLIIWLILTLFNVNKAFHMDDAFHLEAAHHLMEHPLRPMSNYINWSSDLKPMGYYNQPPLFFYSIGLIGSIVGYSEIPLHLYLSIFTFFALYFFQKLTRHFDLPNQWLSLVLFAFCPAFIINQNIMTDVPILALILGSCYYLLKAEKEEKRRNYLLSFTFIGVGLLIKYSVLPIFCVLLVSLLIRKDFKFLVFSAIPIGLVLMWSLWNYLDYGAFHIISRPNSNFRLVKLISYLICAGSVLTFSGVIVAGFFNRKWINYVTLGVMILFLATILGSYLEWFNLAFVNKYLEYFFLANGLIVSVVVVIATINRSRKFKEFIHSQTFIVLLYLAAITAFIIFFAPFNATRHILLSIPFLLIFCWPYIQRATRLLKVSALSMTILFGILHGIFDRQYADYYKSLASEVEVPKNATTWTVGHWGWQWYAVKKGMKQYHLSESQPEVGDYFVYPMDVSKQKIDPTVQIEIFDKRWIEADLSTFVSGSDFASMYNSFYLYRSPWSLSKAPFDTIVIGRVVHID